MSLSVLFLQESEKLADSISGLIRNTEVLKLSDNPTLHGPSAGCSDRIPGKQRCQRLGRCSGDVGYGDSIVIVGVRSVSHEGRTLRECSVHDN